MTAGGSFGKALQALAVLAAGGCREAPPPGAGLAGGAAAWHAPVRVEAPGLHNVFKLSGRLYSGGGPEGDEGFRALRSLGVRTVLSVDGAKPDLDRARAHGLRYVHLPVGYDGVPRPQALRIARAVRDLPGPVYLHCHHGKHRGPAAAATALLCLEADYRPEDALEWLRLAGTDPHYTGLYDGPRTLLRPTGGELDQVPADFPTAASVGGMTGLMVEVDRRWEHLKQVREAGWRAPPGHPDIDPTHEALQLAELYREAARLPESAKASQDLLRRLQLAERAARALEDALRPGRADAEAAGRAFRDSAAACAGCHAKHRGVPKER